MEYNGIEFDEKETIDDGIFVVLLLAIKMLLRVTIDDRLDHVMFELTMSLIRVVRFDTACSGTELEEKDINDDDKSPPPDDDDDMFDKVTIEYMLDHVMRDDMLDHVMIDEMLDHEIDVEIEPEMADRGMESIAYTDDKSVPVSFVHGIAGRSDMSYM